MTSSPIGRAFFALPSTNLRYWPMPFRINQTICMGPNDTWKSIAERIQNGTNHYYPPGPNLCPVCHPVRKIDESRFSNRRKLNDGRSPSSGLRRTVDGRLIQCVAENGYGRAVNRTRIAVTPREDPSDVVSDRCTQIRSVETQGAVAPSIVMYTQFRFENEGNNVQLFCRASGFPAPKITWLDSEEQPLQMDENLYVLPNGDLFIRNVQAYAQYFCVATNVAGEDKVDSFVYATA